MRSLMCGPYQRNDPYGSSREAYGRNNDYYSEQSGGPARSFSNVGPPSYRTNGYAEQNGEDRRGQRARDQSRQRPSETIPSARQDYADDEESRGQRARNQTRRRPSQQAISPPQQQHFGQRQQAFASVPEEQSRYRQDDYGKREDDSARYYEKNASSVALHEDGYKQGKSRQLVGYNGQPETYEIPTLSHGGQGHRSPTTPMSGRQGSTIASGQQVTTNAPQVYMPAFFNEIDSVRETFRELESQIQYLDQLHSRQLQGSGSEEVSYELEQTTAQTRKTTSDLRKRIKDLQETTRIRTHGQAEQERQVRKAQIESVRVRFVVPIK